MGFQWFNTFKKQFWLEPRLQKACISLISVLVGAVPFILSGNSRMGIGILLGVVAGGAAETDDHPKGKLKALGVTFGTYFAVVLLVSLLNFNKLLFEVIFLFTVVALVILGGVNERYRGITYGSILVSIYAMLGVGNFHNWYLQPLMITGGAMVYGFMSFLLLLLRPHRPIEAQLAAGFKGLATYLAQKSKLFDADAEKQAEINRQLAEINIQIVSSLEKCKSILNSYGDENDTSEKLKYYTQTFILLQSFHERSAVNLEDLDFNFDEKTNKLIRRGYAELYQQLSYASAEISQSILLSIPYKHPITLELITRALKTELESLPADITQQHILFLHNLRRSNRSLRNLSKAQLDSVPPELRRDSRTAWEKIKDQLHFSHPRLRYAIRLVSCFAVGFVIVDAFDLGMKGYWIHLTSLFVNQPTYSDTRSKFLERILGTIIGVVAGIAMIQVLPTHLGQLVLLIISVFIFQYYKQSNYSLAVAFITVYVLCSNNFMYDNGVGNMLPRVIDTLLGAMLAFASVRFLWPDWQYKRLPHLLAHAFISNSNYIKAITEEYSPLHADDDKNDLPYRIARREAHKADNELSLSWQSMRIEPKSHRKFLEQAFRLTYINHALLSNISTLAVGRFTHDSMSEELQTVLVQVEKTLEAAAQKITATTQLDDQISLSTTLMDLRVKINEETDPERLQDYKLYYNIADLSNKLLKASKALNQE